MKKIMCKNLMLSIFGMVVNFVGVGMIYFNSPNNSYIIDGGTAGTNFQQIAENNRKKNTLLKIGTILVLVGSLLQSIVTLKSK